MVKMNRNSQFLNLRNRLTSKWNLHPPQKSLRRKTLAMPERRFLLPHSPRFALEIMKESVNELIK